MIVHRLRSILLMLALLIGSNGPALAAAGTAADETAQCG